MATTLEQFQQMLRNVTTLTDVLIQLSENYYLMSRLRPKRIELDGGRSFNLLRHAVGLELVSRIFRLLDPDTGNHGYSGISDRLKERKLMAALLPAFNHDGRKTEADLIALRDEVSRLVKVLKASVAFKRIQIFRHRFVGHIQPTPRMLADANLPKTADVQQMNTKDVRFIIKRLSVICDKLAYINGRGQFAARGIATMAEDDARQLWGLGPRPSRTPSFLMPTSSGREARGKK